MRQQITSKRTNSEFGNPELSAAVTTCSNVQWTSTTTRTARTTFFQGSIRDFMRNKFMNPKSTYPRVPTSAWKGAVWEVVTLFQNNEIETVPLYTIQSSALKMSPLSYYTVLLCTILRSRNNSANKNLQNSAHKNFCFRQRCIRMCKACESHHSSCQKNATYLPYDLPVSADKILQMHGHLS